MAPKQKTFELIPDLPGLGQAQQQRPTDAAAAVQSRPPMTTKQAKKLYRQKGKGPKLSKAEQRRIDLMEQDRIRKEFEKDKAQARARAARDKKKAKEDKEKDEKKKKGLPLVNVHPSQDTISRFISRLGFGGKHNAHLETVQEADSESATEAESDFDVQNEPCEERTGYHGQDHNRKAPGKENEDPGDTLGDSAARPAKRRKLDQPRRNLLDRMIHIPSQRSLGAVARVAQEMEMESWSRPSSVDTDDPATEAMLEDQLIADVELASSKSATRSSPNRQSPPREPLPSRVQPPSHPPLAPRAPSPPLLPPPPANPQSRPQPPRLPNLQGRQLPASTRIPLGAMPQTEQFRAKPKPVQDVFKRPASPFVPGVGQGPATRRGVPAKPPAPPRFKPPTGAVVPRSGGPRFLPKPANAAPTPLPVQASPTYAGSRRTALKPADAFPTSTQLLVMNHVDELFPTPSQEARELYEDQQQAKAANIPTRPPSLLYKLPSFTDNKQVDHRDGRPSVVAPRRPAPLSQDQPGGHLPPEFPFLATQDLVLSSQDIAELDTPSKVRTGPASRTLHVPSHEDSVPSPPQKLALSSDEKTRVVSRVQAPKDATSQAPFPSAGAVDSDADCCRLQSGSRNRPGPRGTPLSPAFKEATQCPNQAFTRPRSQCLRGSSAGPPPVQLNSQQNTSSLQKRSGKHDIVGQGQPKEGSQCSHSPAKYLQGNSPSGDGSAAHRPQKGCAVPQASPPKKRMFGSSGPGAEVLVAMERSYKQNLAEERRRKEELRAQAKKAPVEEIAEQDLAELVDEDLVDEDLVDDEIDFGASQAGSDGLPDDLASADRPPATSKLRSPIGMGTHPGANVLGSAPKTLAGPMASQETDYGDFDFEAGGELEMLADITWADDDLSDI